MTEKDWKKLKHQTGPAIWTGADLLKAFTVGISLGLLLMTPFAVATELVHQFKNPSFSGIGTSSHYLTIENQERTRREKIKDDIQAALDKAEREADNTTLAKFIRNLESRIYSQLSKQLVDQMFGNEEGAEAGSFLVEGNTVNYIKTLGEDGQEVIILTIVGEDGTITTIEIPIGVGNLGG